MVAKTHTFSYSGTLNQAVIPAGTTSVDMYLWGGAGGAGGADAGGPGGSGAAGHHVKKLTYAIATSLVGTTVEVGVGGGGAGGGSGTSAPGGTNGKGKTGFSGGNGGTSGPRGNSGAGGGGGGATTVFIDGSAVAVAGGGGGGAGAGSGSNGTSGINTNSATSNSPATRGEEGVDHSGDGGGSGAGGGGTAGGKSGNGGTNDNGGTGGFSGSNTAQGGIESNGSGVTPGGTSEANYSAGVAVGGTPSGGSGANGLAVVVFNIGVQGYYKVDGDWKALNSMFTKVSGAWKQITAGYVKVSGTWKAMFNSGLNFITTASGFGDSTGNTTSGSGGSGPPIPQSGGCFIAGTMISMADGSQKAVELVDIGDEVSVGGMVFATGKFLIENLYDYNGIQVSGTHMVKEDGAWIRVEDSRLGVSLGNDPAIVYVFGSENRRIIINNTEFTDYFELSEQQELTNHGEDFFSNWQDHDRQIHDKNVNILNA
jgi:hypothetical protein